MKASRVLSELFFCIALLAAAASPAAAQLTIFNVPSGDLVDKGKRYIEFDFVPQAPGPVSRSRTYLYNPRLVLGGPHDTELGVNFPAFHTSSGNPACNGAGTCGYFEPNVKWKYYKSDERGLAFITGVLLHIPMNGRTTVNGVAQNETWGLFYGNFTKKIKAGDYGPRFSAGPYVVADSSKADFTTVGAHRGGAVLGYEQPLSKTVSFVSDWFSGRNYYGYWTPGVSIALSPHVINAGYSFGNDSWARSNATKNRYVFLYYGITF
jgi:hypothetical protein